MPFRTEDPYNVEFLSERLHEPLLAGTHPPLQGRCRIVFACGVQDAMHDIKRKLMLKRRPEQYGKLPGHLRADEDFDCRIVRAGTGSGIIERNHIRRAGMSDKRLIHLGHFGRADKIHGDRAAAYVEAGQHACALNELCQLFPVRRRNSRPRPF